MHPHHRYRVIRADSARGGVVLDSSQAIPIALRIAADGGAMLLRSHIARREDASMSTTPRPGFPRRSHDPEAWRLRRGNTRHAYKARGMRLRRRILAVIAFSPTPLSAGEIVSIVGDTHLHSVYPILTFMERAGWVTSMGRRSDGRNTGRLLWAPTLTLVRTPVADLVPFPVKQTNAEAAR